MTARISALLAVAAALAIVVVAPASGAQTDKGWKFEPTINAPWAHEGEEDAIDDPDPAAAGLCRSSLFATNPYAPTTNVDVIVNDRINNSGVSNFGCTTPQNETTVAVNPRNPLNVVAGANDYRICCDFTGLNDATGGAYYSFDGGNTWGNVMVPGLTAETGGQGNFKRVDSAGDPAMAFGPDGTLYYANIVFSRVTFASGVAVSTSTDGGRTWSAPNMLAYTDAGNFINDKEWIAAGPNGELVVTWTRFNLGPRQLGYRESPIVMALSRDGGKTWNRQGSPVSDRAHPFDQGSMPAFAPDGTLYVAYEGASPASGYSQDQTVIARSTDLGQTFTNTEVGRVYDDLDCYPSFAGSPTLSGEHFRLNGYPSFSIDPTNGRLAVVWADDQGAGSCGTGAASFTGTTAAKVKLVTSSNGTSFSTPSVVSGGDVAFPAVAAFGGKIAVSYYTRALADNTAVCHAVTGNAPGTPPAMSATNVCLDYAARSSTDGFALETRLTSQSSNPYVQFADGGFIGDYTQIAYGADGVAHPTWTDFRGRPGTNGANQDVYTARFSR
jgi:hypothetical protein